MAPMTPPATVMGSLVGFVKVREIVRGFSQATVMPGYPHHMKEAEVNLVFTYWLPCEIGGCACYRRRHLHHRCHHLCRCRCPRLHHRLHHRRHRRHRHLLVWNPFSNDSCALSAN